MAARLIEEWETNNDASDESDFAYCSFHFSGGICSERIL